MSSSHSEIVWHWKAFDELTVRELYAILKLRVNVFVVEQHCAYAELDDRDQQVEHLMGWAGDRLVAYLRLLPPEIAPSGQLTLGRIVTAPDCRKLGLGKALVRFGIDHAQQLRPGLPIRLSAQTQLQAFYESFGFVACSGEYLEDGIAHLDMELAPLPV